MSGIVRLRVQARLRLRLRESDRWRDQPRWPRGARRGRESLGGRWREMGSPLQRGRLARGGERAPRWAVRMLDRGMSSAELMRAEPAFAAEREKVLLALIERRIGRRGIPDFPIDPNTGHHKLPRLDMTIGVGAGRPEALRSVQADWEEIRRELPEYRYLLQHDRVDLLSLEARSVAGVVAERGTALGRYVLVRDVQLIPDRLRRAAILRALRTRSPYGPHGLRLTIGAVPAGQEERVRRIFEEAMGYPRVVVEVRGRDGREIFSRRYDRHGVVHVRVVDEEAWSRWPHGEA